MIRCKFTCRSMTKRKHYNKPGEFVYDYEFSAVTGGSPENEEFFDAIPNARATIGTLKADHFEPGKNYYFDISEATT